MSYVNSAIVSGITFCFVIPCFNKEDNVAGTVASVRQGMNGRDDYEIIPVNDASSDHTLKCMVALAKADPHIRILDNPAISVSAAPTKRGAKAATGTYVMMPPGDDGFPSESIAEILPTLAKPTSSSRS